MCYEVKCSICGKTSWGGCGRHVPSVYNQIPEGQHCQCKDWPGVKTTGEGEGSVAVAAVAAGDSPTGYCTIV